MDDNIGKEYQELIKKGDDKSLFDALDLAVYSHKIEWLDYIIDNFYDLLFKSDPILLISKHVSFFLSNDQINQALEVLDKYKDSPFVSLDVDDFMRDLEKEIKKNYFHKSRQYSEEDLEKDLYSENPDRIARATDFLSKSNINLYLDIIKDYFLSPTSYQYKILIELILVMGKVNQDFVITKDGSKFIFNPSKHLMPFSRKKFVRCYRYIKALNLPPYVIESSLEALRTMETLNYPFSSFESYEPEIVGELIIFKTSQTLNEKYDYTDLIKNTNLNDDEINAFFKNYCKYI